MGVKTLLVATGLFSSAFASSLSVNPYAGYVKYNHSGLKDYATLYGISLSAKVSRNLSVGGSLGYTDIKEKSRKDWKQTDLTLSAIYGLKGAFLYGAIHYLHADGDETDFSKLGKVAYLSLSGWRGNFEPFVGIGYSVYKEGVRATQLDTGMTFYAGQKVLFGREFYLYPYLKATGIFTNGLKAQGLRLNDYYSGEAGIVLVGEGLSLRLSAYAGNRVLYVGEGGYVVYNLKEVYHKGLKLKVSVPFVSMGRGYTFFVGGSVSEYKEAETDKGVVPISLYAGIGF